MKKLAQGFLTIGLVLNAPLSTAHHSFAAVFDIDNRGQLEGEITRVNWTNPHVSYLLKIENREGVAETWELVTHAVVTLREAGWSRETISVGDQVVVAGSLGRGDAQLLSIDTVQFTDGRVLSPGGGGGETANAYQINEVAGIAGVDYGVQTNDYPIDITGAWDNRYQFELTVDDLEPKPTPFTPEGRATYQDSEEWKDIQKLCIPNLPRVFGAPRSMEIVDAGDYYLMLYGAANASRRIFMDGRGPVEADHMSAFGHSNGRWEADRLIIETTNLLPGWLDGSGFPMSGGEGTRLVETYTVSEDGLTMEREMVIHDNYYTAPLTRRRGSSRGDIVLVEEPPCNPAPFIDSLMERNLLDDMLELHR